ncbi:MAG: pyruvate ferredoxin oxidoreductase [candidate division Zixibacteria bacterium CG_4_9_14_3_um_filter_46_8]|nr:MAG: pyruvate ferredoxin oxidoreductase [candidate division Zixibacteria bacterium CG_4_9_14_3_um_filter_46_8]
MKEIRIHGRGGQGAVTAAVLLADAAFNDGLYSQAFPSFGSERMGAPVQSFVRVDNDIIRRRDQVYTPDYLIIQDYTLLSAINVLYGLKEDGLCLIDSEKTPEEFDLDTKAKVVTVPATRIAREVIGRPIQNTTLVGALAGATGLISVEAIKNSVKNRFPGAIGEKNAEAVQVAYDMLKGGR